MNKILEEILQKNIKIRLSDWGMSDDVVKAMNEYGDFVAAIKISEIDDLNEKINKLQSLISNQVEDIKTVIKKTIDVCESVSDIYKQPFVSEKVKEIIYKMYDL